MPQNRREKATSWRSWLNNRSVSFRRSTLQSHRSPSSPGLSHTQLELTKSESMILRVLRLRAACAPVARRRELAFYICLPPAVAVLLPIQTGKSAISPLRSPAHADGHTRAPSRQCLLPRVRAGEALSGTLIDMPVGSAPVASSDSPSLGTVVTATQVVPLSSTGCSAALSPQVNQEFKRRS